MKLRHALLLIFLAVLVWGQPATGQIPLPSDAAMLAKLTEMLRVHREHLVEAIRSARGVENTFRTLRNLDEYERSLRRDINFMSTMDFTRLDDLERLIIYGDQTDFYFRSLSGKMSRDMLDLAEMGQYGDGFLNAMGGMGVVNPDLLRALYSNEQSLAEIGISPVEAAAIMKQLSDESTMLELYELQGTENMISALTAQGESLKKMARDSSLQLDPGQRVMLMQQSEESLIQALKYQQDYAAQLRDRNEKVMRKLMLKAELESEINQLQEFYEWRKNLKSNLGFFDSEFINNRRLSAIRR